MQSGAPDPSPKGGPWRWLILVTRGLIFDQHTRRMVMFYATLSPLLMAFCGDVFLDHWLKEKIQRFAVYYLVCGWLTVLAALLAIYDILLIRLQDRVARRKMRKTMLQEELEDKR